MTRMTRVTVEHETTVTLAQHWLAAHGLHVPVVVAGAVVVVAGAAAVMAALWAAEQVARHGRGALRWAWGHARGALWLVGLVVVLVAGAELVLGPGRVTQILTHGIGG